MLIIGTGIFAQLCHAQYPGVDSAATKIKSGLLNWYKKYPQEKIFIHTSQSVYTGGQTIWFAIYATTYSKPSAISKIVYVQLISDDGKIIVHHKLPLKNGFGNGNINLPDSIKTGWYQLRGFTSWMMNFGEDGYFHQNIYIQNTADIIQKAAPAASAKNYHVDFFPEGGDIIDGQECNIAFRAVDGSGLPVDISGQVIDNNKKTLAPIITAHDGMGSFRLDVAGGGYTAVIIFPDKTVQNIALPYVKKEGVVMEVNTYETGDVGLKIAYTGQPLKYKNVLLAAFQNNSNVVVYPLELSRGINQFELKKGLFSTGILRLTIFDGNNAPLAERLIFVDNHDNLSLQLKADTLAPSPHAKQVFDLSPGSILSRFTGGSLSVSVTDAGAFNKDSTDNICSSLLLSSELKGAVHNPGWYFSNESNMHLLDLVMLTNGWRHFKWDEILNNTAPKLQYPVEKSQYIAGRIENYSEPPPGKPQDIIKLMIVNQDSSKYIGFVNPDQTGSFILTDYNHSGTSVLFMETTDTKNKVKKLKIKLLNTLSDSLKNVPAVPFMNRTLNAPVKNYLLSNGAVESQALRLATGTMLKTVTIKTRKENPTNKVINDHVSPLYRSVTEYTLDLVNDPAPDMSLLNYIIGRFPGLRIIISTTDTVSFIYLGSNTFMSPVNVPPYVYLNEAPTTFSAVRDINLHNVALIRFIPPPVAFAPYNGGNVGALMIYTKRQADELATIEGREKFDQYTFNGYSITREFSSPDYSSIKNNTLPDSRTTLYWDPHLTIDNAGHAKFHFYNSDNAKHFRVIIQGMDAGGHPGYLDEVF